MVITPWDSTEGRRALADYLSKVNDGHSVRGKPGLIGRIKRLLQPAEHKVDLPPQPARPLDLPQ
jgi:hypothetical protein